MKKILLSIYIICLLIAAFNLYRANEYNEQTKETIKKIEAIKQHRKQVQDSLQIEHLEYIKNYYLETEK